MRSFVTIGTLDLKYAFIVFDGICLYYFLSGIAKIGYFVIYTVPFANSWHRISDSCCKWNNYPGFVGLPWSNGDFNRKDSGYEQCS